MKKGSKIIDFHILGMIFSFLPSLDDDEKLDKLYKMERNLLKKWLLCGAKREFEKFGPKSKKIVINTLEYIIHTKKGLNNFLEEGFEIDVGDKVEFCEDIYFHLTETKAPAEFDIESVYIEKRAHFANSVYSC